MSSEKAQTTSSSSNNVQFVELAQYELPKAIESKKDDWVLFGENDCWFNEITDLYYNSTTNNAIINNIVKLMFGKGLKARDARLRPNMYARMKSIIPDSVVKKIVTDYKVYGNFAIQVLYKGGEIYRCEHLPVQLVRAQKCNSKGIVENYYYSDNWADTKKFEPKPYPSFDSDAKAEIKILYSGHYSVGQKYYSNVDYFGALPYCKMEWEISEYLINEVQNSFSPTTIVNYNNGVPTEDEQSLRAKKTVQTLTGSKGKKVIVSFNDNETLRTTIDSVPLNDAPEHYRYLSEEAMRKIMLGHNVTSPLLFGVATTTGFSSNADELKNSYILYDNMAVKPLQETIIEAVDKILAEVGVVMDLYFEQLQPLNASGELTTEQTQMSAHQTTDSFLAEGLISKGESEIDGYELIHVSDVSYDDEEEFDSLIEKANNKQSLLSKVIPAFAKRKSEQDNPIFLTRYRYVGEVSENSREFCIKMRAADRLYRKEDIIAMDSVAVNAGWGAGGADTYSIWLYKGGGGCHHAWQRETYRRKGTDISSPLAQTVSPSQQRKEGYIAPTNDKKVYQRPVDMPNNGFLK